MAINEQITSTQNHKIKNLKKLEKASERKEQNLVLIEGLRETVLAHRGGYEIVSLFICPDIIRTKTEEYNIKELESGNRGPETFFISKTVYDSLAYRETTEGVIATVRPKKLNIENLKLKATPLILVIESVEKPGNLGAMLRTCDAAGVDAVIICDPKTDIYNPNVIRSSVGTVFTNPIAVCDTRTAVDFLRKNQIKTCAAELNAGMAYYEQDFKNGTAIIVGTEATGLSAEWIKAADQKIKIPMKGKIDSLNVSVSAGIILFEARRQRTARVP